MPTTIDAAGFATEQGDSSTTVGVKDLQFAVPDFTLNTTATLTTAEITASSSFGSLPASITTPSSSAPYTGGNSFTLFGSFPALQVTNGQIAATDPPPGFGNSLALVDPVLSTQAAAGTSQGETWNQV